MLHRVFMNNILNIDFDSISNVLSKLFILAAVVMILKEISNPSKNYQTVIPKLPKKRKEFSEKTKKSALFRQGYRCNSCLKPLQDIQDYHHRNGIEQIIVLLIVKLCVQIVMLKRLENLCITKAKVLKKK